jgi:hypothetical protein
VKVNTGKWSWSREDPFPPIADVLKCKLWSHGDYQPLRERLLRPLPCPEIQHQGEFFTLTSTAAGVPNFTGSEEPVPGLQNVTQQDHSVIHFMPLGKGSPVPDALATLKYKLIVVELRSNVAAPCHAMLAIQAMAGVTMLVCGRAVYVRQLTQELEQETGERLHLGDMLLLEKDPACMPMDCRVTTVTVLRRYPLTFPVCLPPSLS